MKHPDKWRETVDVFELPFSKIKVLEILGYPHAGNDVFHTKVLCQDSEVNAYIKVERQYGADISNEVQIISAISSPYAPKILDYSLTEPRFIVTKEVVGERLSFIIESNPKTDVNAYLSKQAATLSEYHNIPINCESVKDRKFFHIPSSDYFDKYSLNSARIFLESNPPKNSTNCFIHGDFHYANILWNNEDIAGVIDYELSGLGVREFDMAWAIFLRPSQKFGSTLEAVEAFLNGYKNPFNTVSFCYYYVQIAAHFYTLGDEVYQEKVKSLIEQVISTCV